MSIFGLVLVVAAGLVVGLPPVPVVAGEPSGVEQPIPSSTASAGAPERVALPDAVAVAPVWPSAGSATVSLDSPASAASLLDGGSSGGLVSGSVAPGGLPVRVSAQGSFHSALWSASAAPSGVTSVDIGVVGREVAAGLGVKGVVFTASTATLSGSAPVELTVGYSGFAGAYGGGYGDRLRLVALPACALSTPQVPACRVQTPVPGGVNDKATGSVSAPLDLLGGPLVSAGLPGYAQVAAPGAGVPTGSVLGSASSVDTGAAGGAGSGMLVLALAAGTSSEQGDWSATSLPQSGSWQAGSSGGGFSYSVDLPVPPAAGGLVPKVSFRYSSASVDGLTKSTTSQTSWIGEGWEYHPGYVERSYRPCRDDGQPSNEGDLCWATQSQNTAMLPPVTVVLNGVSTRLFHNDADLSWKAEDDSAGWRVERVTGLANGARGGEAYKITTRDGTQYWFGSRDRTAYGGVLNVEVFGNDSGEPCYVSSGFWYSHCTMPYRWSLDRVIDVHGNVIDYSWSVFGGAYGGNNGGDIFAYDVSSTLEWIDYGANTVTGTGSTGRVRFETAYRCFQAVSVCDDAPNANAQYWLDTPWDLYCYPNVTSCGNHAPAFFGIHRLTGIRTFIKDAAAAAFPADPEQRVTYWGLTHAFPSTGDYIAPAGDDSSPALWLYQLWRTGFDAPLEMIGNRLLNRVDYGSGKPPMARYRVWQFFDGRSSTYVDYSAVDCTPASLAGIVKDQNSRRCMPQSDGSTWSWWHKYVVDRVRAVDWLGGGTEQRWQYSYSNPYPAVAALWKHDQNWHTPPSKRTWSGWVGYTEVRTTYGAADGTGPQQYQEDIYYRGMNGDKTVAGGWGSRTAVIDDHWDHAIVDAVALAGTLRRSMTFHGPRAADGLNWFQAVRYQHSVTTTGSYYMMANPSITGTRTRETQKITQTKMGGPTYRLTQTDTTYEATYGLATKVTDSADTAITGDETCTSTKYLAANTAKWIVGLPQEVLTTNCAATPSASDYLAGKKFAYDSTIVWPKTIGPAVKGLLLKTSTLAIVTGSTPPLSFDWRQTSRSSYDSHGRVLDSFDPLDRQTSTAYTPAVGGPTTAVAVTGPMGAGWTASTTLDARWGAPLTITDVNGKITRAQYDAVGRLIKVWKNHRAPGTTTGITPDIEYAYPSDRWTLTKTLGPDGQQIPSFQMFDGLLRLRQTQTVSPTGTDRVITDTHYNGIGQAAKTSTYYTTGTVGQDNLLVTALDKDIQVQERTEYDPLGRTLASQRWTGNGTTTSMLWQTTHTYDGDKTVTTTPPAGGTATTTIADVRGRTVELRQHQGGTPAGAHIATTYTYNRLGQLVSMKDPANNTWTYTYNLLGHKTQTVDPDTGTSSSTFDNAGQLLSTTDGHGQQLHHGYDLLGRRTSVREDSLTGTIVSAWLYDTVDKGQLTSTTRHRGGLAYTSAVGSYDDAYRPESTTDTIPGFGTGGTTLTYTVNNTYKANGAPATTVLPGVAGLPAETLSYSYLPYSGAPKGTTATADGGRTYIHDTTYFSDGLVNRQDLANPGKHVRISNLHDPATRRLTSRSLHTEDQATPGTFGTARYQTSYTYDSSANITAVASQQNGVADQQECFTYDYLRRLTQAWTQTSGACTTPQRGGTIDPYWRQWTFDNIGNRLTQTDKNPATGDTVWTSVLGGTDTCGNTVKPHQVRQISATGPLAATATREFCHDGSGSMTKRTTDTGAINDLTWDREGHLASLADISYIYDTDGRRLIAAKPGKQTLYLPDGTELEKIGTADPLGNRYYSGTAIRDAAGLRWLTANHQGSSTYQIDPTSLNIITRRFMPYGEPRGAEPAQGNQPGQWLGTKGYVGGTKDDTGLSHLGAREYDPTTGRFTSADPIIDLSDPQQWHAYSYANGSPLTFSDPSGLLKNQLEDGGCSSVCESTIWYPNGTPLTFTITYHPGTQTWTNELCVFDICPKPGEATDVPGLARATDEQIGNRKLDGSNLSDIQIFAVVGAGCHQMIATAPKGAAPGCSAAYEADLANYYAALLAEKYGPPGMAVLALYGALESLDGSRCGAGARFNSRGGRGGGRPNRPGGRSFDKDTLVLMSDGSTKPIGELEIGDEVLATDPETGQTAPKQVTAVHLNLDTQLANITIRQDDGSVGRLETSQNHPFWNETGRAWTNAGDLEDGDRLLSPTGKPMIINVQLFGGSEWMYDLTVADIHTYYVLAGNMPVLVHNSGCDEWAATFQKANGGVVHTFRPPGGAPSLGDYKLGLNESWGHHTVVVRDGRVFDQFTGPKGMPIDEWKSQWTYREDIDFGF